MPELGQELGFFPLSGGRGAKKGTEAELSRARIILCFPVTSVTLCQTDSFARGGICAHSFESGTDPALPASSFALRSRQAPSAVGAAVPSPLCEPVWREADDI